MLAGWRTLTGQTEACPGVARRNILRFTRGERGVSIASQIRGNRDDEFWA